ncbi:MAG: hypothetical protein AAGN15_01105 [Cyanobacteria bacterium J06581_3]
MSTPNFSFEETFWLVDTTLLIGCVCARLHHTVISVLCNFFLCVEFCLCTGLDLSVYVTGVGGSARQATNHQPALSTYFSVRFTAPVVLQ